MDDACIHAILIPPQLERFRNLCGLTDSRLATSFDGYHRHAIMSADRVFLFPRSQTRVSGLVHEAGVLQALEGRNLPAPRLLGHWRDDGISPSRSWRSPDFLARPGYGASTRLHHRIGARCSRVLARRSPHGTASISAPRLEPTAGDHDA